MKEYIRWNFDGKPKSPKKSLERSKMNEKAIENILKKYICHLTGCELLIYVDGKCSCGLDQALAELAKKPEAGEFRKKVQAWQKGYNYSPDVTLHGGAKLAVEACGLLDQRDEKIKQLEADKGRLEEENRWIPVSERLPENLGLSYFVSNGIWIERIWYCENGWCYQNGNPYPYTKKITYWKPIVLPDQALQAQKEGE